MIRFATLAICHSLLLSRALSAAEQDPRADEALSRAAWIWTSEGGFLAHFRHTFVLSNKVESASLVVTADNGYELYLNGSFLGSDIGAESAVWQSVERFEVAALLHPGVNVVAIRASNLGGEAGVLAALAVREAGGAEFQLVTGPSWRATSSNDPTGFAEAGYLENCDWSAPKVLGPNGRPPWGMVKSGGPRSPNLTGATGAGRGFKDPDPDFPFPEALIAVRGRVPESSTPGSPQAVWRIGNSRAYLELDTLGPSMPGYSLNLLRHRPGSQSYSEQVIYHRPGGLVGSPSISHDGQTVFFSCVPPGEKFWRVCRLPIGGGAVGTIGHGPFHDFDPEPLPDGRIVFSSTRIGSREEYHGNLARSLFVMQPDGSDIRAVTHHIVGDMEPRVTASGNIVFVRQDNFMERAKVETHIHSVRPDGTAGQVLLGPDRGALAYHAPTAAEENGLWLRNYGFGSPAPLPDGRVAALSSFGLVVSGNDVRPQVTLRPALELIDISPLPDGRLLCTLAGHSGIGVLDPDKNEISRIYTKPPFDLHSAVFAGPRPLPPMPRSSVDAAQENHPAATGFLLGQNVFVTRQKNIDMSRVKAIRVIEGQPFANRSARHPYDHLGVEAVELGTVPLAADGSFYVEVPADRALSIQAVDGQGRGVVNELSWIYVRPGEQRSCIGCHSQQQAAPLNGGTIMALRAPPVKLLGAGRPHRWRGNNAANGGVLNLQFERMREIGSIDLRISGPGPRGTDLDELLALLKDGPAESRRSAAQRLSLLREPAAAEPLTAALSDPAPEVRMDAALALAGCGGRASLPRLVRAMAEDEPIVAQAAHRSVQTLLASAESFDAFAPAAERAAAANGWLASLQPESLRAIEANLLERARTGQASEDELNALGRIGMEPAVPALRDFLRHSAGGDLRRTLAGIRALGQLGGENSTAVLTALLRANSALSTNPPAGDHEFGWTQAPVQTAAAAAEALGRIGTPAAEKELIAVLAGLPDFWHYSFRTADHDWLMGCHASPLHFRILEALDRIGSPNAAPVLGVLLKSIPIDPDRGLLFETDSYENLTARVIARSGRRAEIVRACADVLLGHPPGAPFRDAVTASPPAVSVEPMCAESRAAQILSVVCSIDDAPLVRAALTRFQARPPSRTRSWTCFYLARAAGKIQDAEALPLLTAALGEPAEGAAGLLAPPNVFAYQAMTPFYRAAAADALGRIADRAAAAPLLKTVKNLDNALDVRNAAARSLVRLSSGEFKPVLKEFAIDYPEISVRRLLLQACEPTAPNSTPEKLARTK